jgi:FKBP-type peptidyl-prolyl cis-trans isomerase (trigger factor)
MANKELRDKHGHLKRKSDEMPPHIKVALEERQVRADFDARPAYQRSDYLAWIVRAKEVRIQEKRLQQMLDELEAGGVFMRGDHPASRK